MGGTPTFLNHTKNSKARGGETQKEQNKMK
jgi:hypothetical protein